jgi:hypothetical protein
LDFREFIGVSRLDLSFLLRWGFGGQAFAFFARLPFPPIGSSVTLGDDNNNFIFITREYDSSGLKENGTIPFYRRFLEKVFRHGLARIKHGLKLRDNPILVLTAALTPALFVIRVNS